MKRKGKQISIQWKIFFAIIVFAAIVISVIWLFQTVFLDDFYKRSKIDEIQKVAEQLVANIDNTNLQSYAEDVAVQSNISVTMLEMGKAPVIQVKHFPTSGQDKYDPSQMVAYYLKARANGGKELGFSSMADWKSQPLRNNDVLGTAPTALDNRAGGSLDFNSLQKNGFGSNSQDEELYLSQIVNHNDRVYLIFLNTAISPVNATVSTLRTQLIYLTFGFAIIALGFATFLSKSISKPIMVTNESAKELAKGNVDVRFEGRGYKEITELNETLNYAAVELSKSEDFRRELIANVSHDLRTPLTMITGYAEVIRDLPGENTPENVQIIIDEANRLADLVRDMLDISKLQAGVENLAVSEVCITDSIRQIMSRYKKIMEQDGYRIDFQADADIMVECDELKMSQVVYNLVNNAINYTGPDKKVTIRQTIHDKRVRIEVIDTGRGIDPELLPYVWDRYYKIDKNHAQSVKGTGLGLSIVKKILELHGLPFGVESTPGEGSDFWFEMNILSVAQKSLNLPEKMV